MITVSTRASCLLHRCRENDTICVLKLLLLCLLFSSVAILSLPKETDLVPKIPDSSLRYIHIKHVYRGVTRLDGSQCKNQVWRPHVQT